jgi:hypothetical protein
MMEDFLSIDSDVAVIQEAADVIVNSIIEEKGKKCGNDEEEEYNEEVTSLSVKQYIWCAYYSAFWK